MGAGAGGSPLSRQRVIAIVIAMASHTVLSCRRRDWKRCGRLNKRRCRARARAEALPRLKNAPALDANRAGMACQAIEQAMRRMREIGFLEPNFGDLGRLNFQFVQPIRSRFFDSWRQVVTFSTGFFAQIELLLRACTCSLRTSANTF